jgi:hypothetical protein
MNGKVQYRGLPAPPLEALEFDDGMPPPCPRDMYSQYAVISQMNLEVVCYMLYNVDFQVR